MPDHDLIPQPAERALDDPAQPVHPVIAYLAGLASERSRRVMASDLATLAALYLGIPPDSVTSRERHALVFEVPWPAIRIAQAQALRARLIARYQPATANRMLSALRGVLKACWQLDLMSGEDYHKARSVENVKGHTLPAGRDLAAGERAALFRVCADDLTPAGARDAALLACADANLRRAEIAALDLADVDLTVGTLKVRGKGRKERSVPLNTGQLTALEDWLAVRGMSPGALFWPVNKGGNLMPRRMTSQAVYNVMQKRGQEAGVSNFSPHDFRRTYAGDLLDAGADIVTVAQLMGHADVTTTARYDRRPAETRRKAANLRHTPYTGRRQKFNEGG